MSDPSGDSSLPEESTAADFFDFFFEFFGAFRFRGRPRTSPSASAGSAIGAEQAVSGGLSLSM